MKILDITTFFSTRRGGITTYLERKAEIFARFGEFEHLLILGGEEDGIRSFHGSRCYWIKSRKVKVQPHYRYLINFPKIFNVLRREQPEVIETSDPYWMPWYLLLMRRGLPKTKLFLFYRSDFPDTYVYPVMQKRLPQLAKLATNLSWAYARLLANRLDGLLVHTDIMRRKLQSRGIRCPIFVVGNLTDVESFAMAEPDRDIDKTLTERFGPVGHKLLYCGRLSFEKGVDLLVDTYREVRQELDDPVLLVVGDGHKREHIERLASKVENRIHLLPATADRSYLASLYRACDALVMPGPHETFSIVTLEAIASGLPVAGVGGTGGVRALIQPGIGFIADEATPQAFKQVILQALQPKGEWYQEVVRQKLMREYKPERVYKKLIDAYGIEAAQPTKSSEGLTKKTA